MQTLQLHSVKCEVISLVTHSVLSIDALLVYLLNAVIANLLSNLPSYELEYLIIITCCLLNVLFNIK